MALYDLIKACILFVNALAIINERFLRQIGAIGPQQSSNSFPNFDPNAGFGGPGTGQDQSVKARILSIVGDRNVKVILQVPLIVVNSILIVLELLLG